MLEWHHLCHVHHYCWWRHTHTHTYDDDDYDDDVEKYLYVIQVSCKLLNCKINNCEICERKWFIGIIMERWSYEGYMREGRQKEVRIKTHENFFAMFIYLTTTRTTAAIVPDWSNGVAASVRRTHTSIAACMSRNWHRIWVRCRIFPTGWCKITTWSATWITSWGTRARTALELNTVMLKTYSQKRMKVLTGIFLCFSMLELSKVFSGLLSVKKRYTRI